MVESAFQFGNDYDSDSVRPTLSLSFSLSLSLSQCKYAHAISNKRIKEALLT